MGLSTHLPTFVSRGRARRLACLAIVAALAVPMLASQARSQPTLDELKDRLAQIQDELDAATANVEGLRLKENDLRLAVAQADIEIDELQRDQSRLQDRAVAAAKRIYMMGEGTTLDVILSAESFAEIASRSQALSRVSELDLEALVDFERAEARLTELQDDLIAKADDLTATRSRLDAESDELQALFDEVTAEYKELGQKLAAAARARAAALAGGQVVINSEGMTCPIAAPHSFIDSWGFPRPGGRTHEGTDMMAAMGAPVVAITDGTITYEGYGTTAGNWFILSGDDGHEYWYMHQQANLVTSGSVSVGEKIGTVGDTGNAIGGPPHVHFEYHPGGGGPINPYPLLTKVCRGEE